MNILEAESILLETEDALIAQLAGQCPVKIQIEEVNVEATE